MARSKKKAPLRVEERHLHIDEQLRHLAVPVGDLVPDPQNARRHNAANVEAVQKSLTRFGQYLPIIVQKQGMIVRVGNCRLEAAKSMGWTHIAALIVEENNVDAVARGLVDNRTGDLAEWDPTNLAANLAFLEEAKVSSMDVGFELPDIAEITSGFKAEEVDPYVRKMPWDGGVRRVEGYTPLSDRFGAPPFSVLDARQGYWNTRKREWIAMGIQSELGRDEGLAFSMEVMGKLGAKNATSVFDPVLSELLVRWFSPEGGSVLDPFAGGSVRGIVSAKLGRTYLGVDLRQEQVEANREQAKTMGLSDATWVQGDSNEVLDTIDEQYDMILSCPPYYDLEVYSDEDGDLSNLDSYEEFLIPYREIIAKAVSKLKDNSFAAWVVGEVRDKKGFYRGFVPDTIRAFQDAGAQLYNEAILITPGGTLALRAGRQFDAGRKLGKAHQNVLVFYKGDPTKIKGRFGVVNIPTPDAPDAYTGDGEQTPIEAHGDKWLKRDDLFTVAGTPGGKARTCWALSQGAKGLVTAGSRQSPQVNIVAHIARRLGVPCRVHCPTGDLTPELISAEESGAEIEQHKPGYNSVIIARAREDAKERGWTEIPFGMECEEAIKQTRAQVPAEFPSGAKRLVVPVGSGMSLSGVLHGLEDHGHDIPVLAVQVGADPRKRLDAYAPKGWADRVELVESPLDYHTHAPTTVLNGVELDPVYEAKCIEYLQPGDILWCVGIRETSK